MNRATECREPPSWTTPTTSPASTQPCPSSSSSALEVPSVSGDLNHKKKADAAPSLSSLEPHRGRATGPIPFAACTLDSYVLSSPTKPWVGHPLSSSPARSFALDLSPPPSQPGPSTSSSSSSSYAKTTATSSGAASSAANGLSWWRRLLAGAWVVAKLSVMFTLVSVLWLILAVPAIDQHLQQLHRFFFRHSPAGDAGRPAEATQRRTESKRNGDDGHMTERPSSLAIDDDIDDGDDHATDGGHQRSSNVPKTRLNGSQQLRNSEEGNSEEVVAAAAQERPCQQQHHEDTHRAQSPAGVEHEARPQGKRKRIVKSVRWSDDAIETKEAEAKSE